MRTGIIHDEPEADYHASGAYGHSRLCEYLESPSGYFLRHIEQHPIAQRSETDSMALGTAFHALMESGLSFESRFRIRPAAYRNEKGEEKPWHAAANPCKKWLADCAAEGMTPITSAESDIIWFLRERVLSNPAALALLEIPGLRHEVSLRTTDERRGGSTGLPIQARLDLVAPGTMLADFKTGSKKPAEFARSVVDYGYHVQAAMYQRLWFLLAGEVLPFLFLYVQTQYPFETRVYQLPEDVMDLGWQAAARALEGISAQDWGKPQVEPEEVTLTPWQARTVEAMALAT